MFEGVCPHRQKVGGVTITQVTHEAEFLEVRTSCPASYSRPPRPRPTSLRLWSSVRRVLQRSSSDAINCGAVDRVGGVGGTSLVC